MIRTLIVDDEPLARQGLRLRLQRERDIEIVGEAVDGAGAVRMVGALLPDLVFLDIQMPGANGFDVLERIAGVHLPVIVFVTAFDQYAIRAFEVRAIDYLLKPFTAERFEDALQRARRELAVRHEESGASRVGELLSAEPTSGTTYLERLAVRDRDRFLLVKIDEVDWLESDANYVEVHVKGRTFLIRSTLTNVEQKLDPARFVRIHRSVIVNVDRVAEIRSDAHGDYDVTLKDGKVLRMTRNHAPRLLGRV